VKKKENRIGLPVEFTIRPSFLARLTILVPIALASIACFISRSLIVILVCAIVLTIVAIWWIKFARIRIVINNRQLEIFAPLYYREIEKSQITDANVHDDQGYNHGLVNWPVTGNRRSVTGVRINMGGKAALRIQTENLGIYQIVFADKHTALACLAHIKTADVSK